MEVSKGIRSVLCTKTYIDTSCGGSWIDDYFGAILLDADIGLLIFVLFGDERRNVALETASANPHDDKADGEDGNGGFGLGDDLGNGREDEEDMADNGDDVGVLDREVATKVLVCKPGASEWGDVRPELVDYAIDQLSRVRPEESTYTWSDQWTLSGPFQERLSRAS